MYDQMERELKILLTKTQYETILHSYDFGKPTIQTNVYFDDDAGTIKQKGAMRIRTIGDRHIFTLKIRKDPITQIELEKEIPVNTISEIRDPEILGWMKENGIPANTHPFASSVTERRIVKLENAELCLDKTDFSGTTDYELEYEYTKDHDGISAFNRILEPIHILYKENAPSKLARAVKYLNS